MSYAYLNIVYPPMYVSGTRSNHVWQLCIYLNKIRIGWWK